MSENDSTVVVEETTPQTTPTPTSLDDLQPKMKLTGTVTRLELYGAFIDVGVGVDALIHISKLGAEHVNRVADVLNVGDQVAVWVDKVEPERQQLMVTMIEPLSVEWRDLKEGQVYSGTVSRLEAYGAFINIGAEREGLVHISELSHDYVKQPSEVVNVGDEVQVQVLGYSKKKRRIDLSVKALLEKPEQPTSSPSRANEYRQAYEPVEMEPEDEEDMPTAMEIALRQAMGDDFPTNRQKTKQSRKQRQRSRDRDRARQEELLNRTLYNN